MPGCGGIVGLLLFPPIASGQLKCLQTCSRCATVEPKVTSLSPRAAQRQQPTLPLIPFRGSPYSCNVLVAGDSRRDKVQGPFELQGEVRVTLKSQHNQSACLSSVVLRKVALSGPPRRYGLAVSDKLALYGMGTAWKTTELQHVMKIVVFMIIGSC